MRTLITMVGYAASPLLMLEETASEVLIDVASAAGITMGALPHVHAHEMLIQGSVAGSEGAICLSLLPFDHRFLMTLVMRTLVDVAAVDRMLRRRLGPYECRVRSLDD